VADGDPRKAALGELVREDFRFPLLDDSRAKNAEPRNAEPDVERNGSEASFDEAARTLS
jgi:hypothetical protein